MDIREIKELIKAVEKSDLAEFEYENDSERIYLSKSSGEVMTMAAPQPAVQQMVAAPAPAAPIAAPVAAAPVSEESGGTAVTSPIVGTFYGAPSPDTADYVKVGDVVSKGQTLCIVEAMKIMNEIEAEFDCKIVKILGVNAKPVEYGEAIFIVEPA